MFKFLHASDIHLDSPLIGLERYEAAPVESIRGATRRAFDNLVQLAIDEEVAFVLIAGDLYDGDWKDYRTGLYFVNQMSRLRDAGIPVFIVAGNHDAASRLTKNLRNPDNVKFFSTKHPETYRIEDLDVAIHGQGFATQAVLDDLAAAYPVSDLGTFNIGILHTSLDGRVGHASYAPTSQGVLVQKGYSYWALGHVHNREIISQDPWIVFPGNLQGRHIREYGAKGCTIVTVEDGSVTNVEERHVDVMRWATCKVDVQDANTMDDILEKVAQGLASETNRADDRALAIRVEITGSTSCHHELASHSERWINEVRAIAIDNSSYQVWVEKVRFLTSPPTTGTTDGNDLSRIIGALGTGNIDRAQHDSIIASLSDIYSALPPELLGGDDPVEFESPEVIERLVKEARDILYARIIQRENSK